MTDAWQTLNVFLKTNDDVRLGDLGVPLAMIFWFGREKSMELGGFDSGWMALAICGCYVKETIMML